MYSAVLPCFAGLAFLSRRYSTISKAAKRSTTFLATFQPLLAKPQFTRLSPLSLWLLANWDESVARRVRPEGIQELSVRPRLQHSSRGRTRGQEERRIIGSCRRRRLSSLPNVGSRHRISTESPPPSHRRSNNPYEVEQACCRTFRISCGCLSPSNRGNW
jgi:hypothetical protein